MQHVQTEQTEPLIDRLVYNAAVLFDAVRKLEYPPDMEQYEQIKNMAARLGLCLNEWYHARQADVSR
jgi:hypothetical protein